MAKRKGKKGRKGASGASGAKAMMFGGGKLGTRMVADGEMPMFGKKRGGKGKRGKGKKR